MKHLDINIIVAFVFFNNLNNIVNGFLMFDRKGKLRVVVCIHSFVEKAANTQHQK